MNRISVSFFAIILATIFTQQVCLAQKGGRISGVVIAKSKNEPQTLTQSFVGTVTPVKSSVVGSAVDGRVLEILFEEGDFVEVPKPKDKNASEKKKSRPALVRLATKAIEIQIQAAKAELTLRNLTFEELKKSLPKDIQLLKTQVQEAKTQTSLAKSDYDRMVKVNQTAGAVSDQELDVARSTFQKNQAIQMGLEIQLEKALQTREILIAKARANILSQQEEVNRLADIRSKYTIRAPFAGYIVSKTTEIGHWVSKGEDVFQIVQADPIEVVINVPQSLIHKVQVAKNVPKGDDQQNPIPPTGSKAEVSFDDHNTPLSGIVHSVVPQADLRSRTFPVRIRVKNPRTRNGHLLKFGMITSVRLRVGKPSKNILVKKDALVLNGAKVHVVAVQLDKDGKQGIAKIVPVKTGKSFGGWIEIQSAIQPGQWVVTEGNERLKPDQKVKILGRQD